MVKVDTQYYSQYIGDEKHNTVIKTNIMDDVTVEMNPCWGSQTIPCHPTEISCCGEPQQGYLLLSYDYNNKKNICKTSY